MTSVSESAPPSSGQQRHGISECNTKPTLDSDGFTRCKVRPLLDGKLPLRVVQALPVVDNDRDTGAESPCAVRSSMVGKVPAVKVDALHIIFQIEFDVVVFETDGRRHDQMTRVNGEVEMERDGLSE